MWAIGEPSGPIENGTTYIVRPRIEPRKRSVSVSRISSGSRQLLVGPASASLLRADEGAVLDARHVARVGAGQVGVRPLGLVELLEGAGVDELPAEAVVLLRGAVAPVHRVGLGQLRDLVHPGQKPAVGGPAAVWRSCSIGIRHPTIWAQVRAALRFVASVMMVSGVLLIADAGATLLWQEPVSWFVASASRPSSRRRWPARRSG